MTVPLDQRAAVQLVPSYLAPAAELLGLAAGPPVQDAPVAVISTWAALLLAALQERQPLTRFMVMESLPPPTLAPLETATPRSYGRALPLPLRPQSLGGMVQGLALQDAAVDGTMLREAARTLLPGGTYVGAFLMRGSFDAFFTAAHYAATHPTPLVGVAPALGTALGQFRHPDELRTLAIRAGLVDVELGLEEHALAFPAARAFLADAGVVNVLLRHMSIPDSDARTALFDRVVAALDATANGGVNLRVLTGLLRGVKPGGS